MWRILNTFCLNKTGSFLLRTQRTLASWPAMTWMIFRIASKLWRSYYSIFRFARNKARTWIILFFRQETAPCGCCKARLLCLCSRQGWRIDCYKISGKKQRIYIRVMLITLMRARFKICNKLHKHNNSNMINYNKCNPNKQYSKLNAKRWI